MSKFLIRTVLLLLLLAGPAAAQVTFAQDAGISQKDQEKIQRKQEKEKKKKAKEYEKQKRKDHLDHQDKATRKRIKKHDKRADRGGSDAHRDGFFQRLFPHKSRH